MKLKERLKMMDKVDKITLVLTSAIIFLLVINAIVNIRHAHQFQERVDAGNARWEQVEDRVTAYEHKIDLLEKDIENLQLKLDKGGQ